MKTSFMMFIRLNLSIYNEKFFYKLTLRGYIPVSIISELSLTVRKVMYKCSKVYSLKCPEGGESASYK